MLKNCGFAALIVCIFIMVGLNGCVDNEENQSPIVTIIANPIEGFQPLSVLFLVNATDPDGTIQSYQWEFGDGTTSNLTNVSHTFHCGEYEVMVTVTDNEGAMTTKKVAIKVHNQPPTISLSAHPTTGSAPLEVYFNGTSADIDGNISYYKWDFKDNHTSDAKNPSHIFQASGTYNVTFTVIDNDGGIGSDVITIVVTEGTIFVAERIIMPS